MNELDLFTAAIAIKEVGERRALLDRECTGNPELRQRLERLVAAHFEANILLDAQAVVTVDRGTSSAGEVIAGRYKLLEAIGEGGMGTVWVAEQTEPVRRKVALKLIKAGMDSKSVLARFEAERQALAVMDHPNIAKVLDGGLTDTGRPYFVMEYVKGVPITEYCDATRLSIPERLKLFVQVCQAVQHAHQKGIIHRDLKPSNILVAPYDDKPVPKVIDFGLAKAMHQSLTERTLHTAHETVLGTPLYMSPEQAQLNNVDVDTRSDIYSLGVLLYELLTGTTPLEKQRFKEAAWDEVKRIIREEEPPRPSTRLSSTNTLPSLAAGRQTEPARLTKLVRGELDWIVMKSLEKDRSRRYETATGFAADIQRYLAGEPVLAAPPSTRYRLRKFVRRNRVGVILTFVVAASLVAIVINLVLASRAVRLERDRALASADAEKEAKQEALRQKKEAEQQAAIAKAVSDFVQNDLIREASPDAQPNRDITLREILDRAAERIDGRFEGQPRTEAAIRESIGEAYESLAIMPQVERHGRRTLELCRQEYGEDDPRTLKAMHRLAFALRQQRRFAEAEPLYKKALDGRRRLLGEGHPDVIATLSQLAWTRIEQGRPAEAEIDLRNALEWRRRTLGDENLDTLRSMSTLRAVLKRMGRNTEALELEKEVVRIAPKLLKSLNKDNPKALEFMGSLMSQLRTQGRLDEAHALGAEAIECARRVLGDSHATTFHLLRMHGETLIVRGARGPAERAEAEKFLRDTLARMEAPDAQAGSLTARPWMYNHLADLLRNSPQRYDETIQIHHKAVESWQKLVLEFPSVPEYEEQVAHMYRLWGFFEWAHGKHQSASDLLRRAIVVLERGTTLFPDRVDFWALLADTHYQLSPLFIKLDQPAEGEKALRRAVEIYDIREARFPRGEHNENEIAAYLDLGLLHLAARRYTEAEAPLRMCLAIREKTQPDAWSTYNTKSLLGGALLGQKKYTEAEPLLLAGYEGMKQREAKILPNSKVRLQEALDRLIELYSATDKPDEVKKWQTERAKYPQSAPSQESK